MTLTINQPFLFPESKIKDKAARSIVQLKEKGHVKIPLCLAVGILDFGNGLRIGKHCLQGMRRSFTAGGLNPGTIPEEKQHLPVTLLIHGIMHNQGVWKDLSRALTSEERIGAVFTLNLPSFGSNRENRHFVQEKMAEITALYHRKPRFNLVGYSNGGVVAIDACRFASERTQRRINKLIMVGCHVGQYLWYPHAVRDKIYSILASKEFLDSEVCMVPEERKIDVPTTHLGLVRAPETAEALIHFLTVEEPPQPEPMTHQAVIEEFYV